MSFQTITIDDSRPRSAPSVIAQAFAVASSSDQGLITASSSDQGLITASTSDQAIRGSGERGARRPPSATLSRAPVTGDNIQSTDSLGSFNLSGFSQDDSALDPSTLQPTIQLSMDTPKGPDMFQK